MRLFFFARVLTETPFLLVRYFAAMLLGSAKLASGTDFVSSFHANLFALICEGGKLSGLACPVWRFPEQPFVRRWRLSPPCRR